MPRRVSNRTKFQLRVTGAESHEFSLAPFERRDFKDGDLKCFDTDKMTRHGLVSND